MHTVVTKNDENGNLVYSVVYGLWVGPDGARGHVVFSSPKQSVAWGVCNFFNGSDKSINVSVQEIQLFFDYNEGGGFNHEFYK